MINRNDWIDDFQKNISELIARSPAADIERNMKAFMAQAFTRMDLVTREEFDVQVQLVEKALLRITALESRLDQLEGRRPDVAPPVVDPTLHDPVAASAAAGVAAVDPALRAASGAAPAAHPSTDGATTDPADGNGPRPVPGSPGLRQP